MKKILFAALLSVIVFTSQAQMGIKGGLNFSNWRGKDADENAALAGYYIGVYGNVKVYHNFCLQSEVAFSQEGVKQKGGSDKIILGYLNITELLRYNIPHSAFFVGTGPQLGMLLNSRIKESGVTTFLKDEFKLSNISWAFAVGYDLKMGLGFSAGYNLGLSNIVSELEVEVKQSSLQAGLRYNIKSKLK
jgi:hypothetical protein